MDFQTFKSEFERQPLTRQFDQLRRAGFSVADPEQAQLVRAAAERVGLLPTAAPVEVLYARQYSAVGCPSCGGRCDAGVATPEDCAAVNFPVADIQLDPARFQNRTDAFSELSAEAVAKHYDPNKFDAVVLWRDPARGGQAFMLSGHSRYEGRRRRGDKTIQARFFQGSEAEAIQFARVDANRAANAESLVEDLKAYKLMRDGDPARNLKPAKKSELARAFKGKAAKLAAWAHLNPGGLFVQALGQDSRTEYPYLEKFAQWVGQLRAQHPELTNTHEADCFSYFYGEQKNQRISREDFDQLVTKRLAWGKPRLFPECADGKCADLQDLAKKGAHAAAYRELEQLSAFRDMLNKRLKTSDRSLRIYTDAEREVVRQQLQLVDEEMKRVRRDVGKAEAAPGLFGPRGRYPWVPSGEGPTLVGKVGGRSGIQAEELTEMNIPEFKISYRKRRFGPPRKFSTVADVGDLFRQVWNDALLDVQESFYVLYLTGSGVLLGYYRHTVGSIDSAPVDVRIVLGAALKSLATVMIVAHNHPSGILKPSQADINFSKGLQSAAKTVGVTLLDSLVVTRSGQASLYDEGYLMS